MIFIVGVVNFNYWVWCIPDLSFQKVEGIGFILFFKRDDLATVLVLLVTLSVVSRGPDPLPNRSAAPLERVW